MGWCVYNSQNSFHWNSDLTDRRKDEILEWLETLGDSEIAMIEDMLEDSRWQGYDDGAAESIGEDI